MKYLYLKYISDNVESVLVFRTIWKTGAVLAFGLLVITTFLKYVLTKMSRKEKQSNRVLRGMGTFFENVKK